MPYHWSHPPRGADPDLELELWPHRSLPRRGFAAFVLATFTLITIPLYPLLGTVLLWGLLPFLLLAVGGVWWALEHSYRSARLCEVLTIAPDVLRLVRTGPRGEVQEWACDRHWARLRMHEQGGPVSHYLTLMGGGREVEIGAFLSEDERRVLHGELADAIRPPPAPMTG